MAYLGRKGASAALTSADIPDGSVTTAKLIDSSVTSAKIGVDVIVAEDIANNAITVAEIADDAVTAAKLANSINTDIATGVTANTTANAALPKAGGTMSGNIVMADDTSIGIGDAAERIEFDGAGDISVLGANLGVGIAAPTGTLHVYHAGGNAATSGSTQTAGNLRIGTGTGGTGVLDIGCNTSSGPSYIQVSQANDLSVHYALNLQPNGGNVGIGTNSPSSWAKLQTSSQTNIACGGWTTMGTVGSSAASIFGHNVHVDPDNANKILSTNTGYYGQMIRMYYNQGIAFHCTNTAVTTAGATFNLNNTQNEVMRITNDGNVGIGTTSPSVPTAGLEIENAGQCGLRVSRSGVTNANLDFRIETGGAAELWLWGNFDMNFATNNARRMTISNSGNIGVPNNGTYIYNASDRRVKENINDLSGCLTKINQLQGVSFNWIDGFCDEDKGKIRYGLIAQDVNAVDSNLIDSFSVGPLEIGETIIDDPLRVNDKFIIPMLVEAVKELSAKVTALESA